MSTTPPATGFLLQMMPDWSDIEGRKVAEFPALPLWTDAYLADLHPKLTLEQHGCMVLLMQFAWRSPDCRLEDDDARMARMLAISKRRWRERLRPIMETLWDIENGFWTQKRLLKEFKWVKEKSRKSAQAGRASALKRKDSASTNVPSGLQPGANTRPTPTPTPTPFIPLPSSTTENHKRESSLNRQFVKSEFDGAFDAWWKAYPRKVGKRSARTKYEGILKREEATEADLMQGLQAYCAFVQAEGTETKFVAHPTTWLNQGRWQDDLTVRRKPTANEVTQAALKAIERKANGNASPDHEPDHHPDAESLPLPDFTRRRP